MFWWDGRWGERNKVLKQSFPPECVVVHKEWGPGERCVKSNQVSSSLSYKFVLGGWLLFSWCKCQKRSEECGKWVLRCIPSEGQGCESWRQGEHCTQGMVRSGTWQPSIALGKAEWEAAREGERFRPLTGWFRPQNRRWERFIIDCYTMKKDALFQYVYIHTCLHPRTH